METAVLENKKRPRSISFSGLNANVVKLWQQQLILRQAVILFSLERNFFSFPRYIDIVIQIPHIHSLWTHHECQRRKYLIYQKYLIISIFRYGEKFQNIIGNMACSHE